MSEEWSTEIRKVMDSLAELKERNEVLLDFAKEVALGAYSEREAQQRARLLVLEQAR